MGFKNSCFEMTIPIFTSNILQLNPLEVEILIHYSVEQIFTCYHDSRTKYTQKSLILIHIIFKWICEHRTTILSIQKSLILQNATILKEDHQSNGSKMDLQRSSTKYSMKIMTVFYRIVQMIEEEEKLSN